MASAEVDIPHRKGRPTRDGGDSYRPSPPRARTPPPAKTDEEKQAIAKAEYEKLLNMRSGGTYIPPARLRALQSQITDKTSKEYQRMAWEALKKGINGLINKVNTGNIKYIVPELFDENLIRGRGLFCRSIMKAQAASLPFTPVYAAMAAIVNTKLPQVGELLIKRLVMQFRKGFRRDDKAVCISSTTFLGHLINQQVQHELLAGQILLLLLNKPTDASVEIAVGFCRVVGQFLEEMQPSIAMVVFDQFRNILHEADIDKRTQYMIEVLFQVRKDKFKDNPSIREELDLVEEEDQITHQVELAGEIDVQDGLNIFKFDPDWEENEEAYRKLKAEILGEGSDDDDEGDEDEDESSDEEEEEEEQKAMEIKDQSNADLVNLRRTIYLTIMSSADPEEAVHKLMKINLPVGQEPELPSMIVECCSQEKTYTKFFGLIGERFAKINRLWCDLFEEAFAKYYDTIHRYENNKLRNIAMLFGHMFGVDALGWHCLSVIHLNEDETTSSSRIFIKILFQQIAEEIGLPKLKARLADEVLRPNLEGLFPKDNPRNIRFSINYFTSIGMGALTEEMREYLQNMPKPALPAPPAADSDSESVSSSYFSSTGSYSSRSRSRSRSRTPRRYADRGRSYSRSVSPRGRKRTRSYSSSRSGSYSRSRSPPPRRRARSDSYSASPPRRSSRRIDDSLSRSPPPRRGRSASYSSYSRSPTPPRRRRDAFRSPTPPPPRGRRRSPSYDSRERRPRSVSSLVASQEKKGFVLEITQPGTASGSTRHSWKDGFGRFEGAEEEVAEPAAGEEAKVQ
ncbi:Pre-mRNA-splicing factor-like protein [Hapsidospora chrysogenum ATCC 11550]|uniref:Pre-mRNA-splicing factor CWC22 n=1 Tax=Hapsidospora chrysogenum (strain ATCC 11550 / CBS 779.69 / DSM 880 / IAM 14645 / JCM 23072 / IMI 49137) TaxID=857340 RepID=A0A086THS8_HAPC1|nr:Pre-mRNA-splicing factor-like protein [Hapsidospora chrysogenum ATCC 11550]